jgi:hypothetical protein
MQIPRRFGLKALMAAVTTAAISLFLVNYYSDVNRWRRDSNDVSFHRILHTRLKNGDSLKHVNAIIGPGEICSIAGRMEWLKESGFPNKDYPDGFRDSDTLMMYVTNEGECIYLQFRDAKLVNHDQSWYAVPEDSEAGFKY